MRLSGQSQEPGNPGLELSAFDGLLQSQPQPLLIGGQAVNLWAQVFLQESSELEQMQPFLSRDCDLLGSQALLLQLARNTDWKVTLSPKGQPSPVIGYLVKQDAGGRQLLVEVLHSVKGLAPKTYERKFLSNWEAEFTELSVL